jgi:hypothetical protein
MKKISNEQLSSKAHAALKKAANEYDKLYEWSPVYPSSSSWDSLGEMPTVKKMTKLGSKWRKNFERFIKYLKQAEAYAKEGGYAFDYQEVE